MIIHDAFKDTGFAILYFEIVTGETLDRRTAVKKFSDWKARKKLTRANINKTAKAVVQKQLKLN